MSSVDSFREFVSERLTAAATEIFRVFKQTVVEYEKEIDRQRKLLDTAYKPEVKLYRIELPQQHVCQEEEVLTDLQLCNQERNSSLDQEEPEPPQIKEEEEDEFCTSQQGEQLELKQETDISPFPPYEEGDDSEDQASYFNPDETQSAAERQSVVNKPVKSSVEPNSDLQPLSNDCHVAESQDQTGDEHGDSGSTRNAESESLKNCFWVKMFDFNSKLNNHMKVHAGEKPCVCETCGKRFDCKRGLLVHMRIHTRIHTSEGRFTCKICGQDFRSRSSLLDHMRIHTSEECFTCKICGNDFRFRRGLLVHMSKAHAGEKPFTCKTCGKHLISESNLNGHMRIHTGEKPFICKTCGKDFRFRYGLFVHTKRAHTGEKQFVCKTCGKYFTTSGELKNHMRVHTGERPFVCKICGQDFNDRSTWVVHRKIHTGEKPYNCETCGKSFSAKTNLTKHVRIHTGDRLFSCKGRDFSSSSVLSAHKKRSHSGQETVPFQGLGGNVS